MKRLISKLVNYIYNPFELFLLESLSDLNKINKKWSFQAIDVTYWGRWSLHNERINDMQGKRKVSL